jgi:hypothetical protein
MLSVAAERELAERERERAERDRRKQEARQRWQEGQQREEESRQAALGEAERVALRVAEECAQRDRDREVARRGWGEGWRLVASTYVDDSDPLEHDKTQQGSSIAIEQCREKKMGIVAGYIPQSGTGTALSAVHFRRGNHTIWLRVWVTWGVSRKYAD